MNNQSYSTIGSLMLVGGGLIGAGVTLLVAPKAGKETRKDIVLHARKLRRKSDEAVYDFADSICEMVETIGGKAAEILKQGKDITDEGKKELLTAIEKAQVKLQGERGRLARIIG